VIFSDVTKKRVEKLTGDYAKAFVAANSAAAKDALGAYPGSPTSLAAADALMSTMHKAGGDGVGYRKVSGAAAQIQTANNQQVSRLRAETITASDAAGVFILNEMQERTDRTAAFEQAVRKWTPVSSGASY
jgi:uncharacterized membrane protein YccC